MDIPQITSKSTAETGEMGQKYLASGKHVALRRWQEGKADYDSPRSRDYETVGYLLSGVLELDLDGEVVTLQGGDSWLVPAGANHRYRVLEPIVALEATSPPARYNELDDPSSN
ncbi:Cupin domain protein [Rubripirellula amarantea]|uniref:Cupin domain protein n=1 Tax=Rubripirellula amarantea TaxID=2527999 RepID=A0A5C5WTD8_9BACT|nr:cupin domain-containing protein [Rubripirellula amarantea]TWT53770.1 Cupin domain protein [Rubripirellula amarantea]